MFFPFHVRQSNYVPIFPKVNIDFDSFVEIQHQLQGQGTLTRENSKGCDNEIELHEVIDNVNMDIIYDSLPVGHDQVENIDSEIRIQPYQLNW